MTIDEWLAGATKKLENAGIATARLDAEVLLADAMGKDRAWLLAHFDFDLKGLTLARLDKQIERRKNHEPLAYIRGRQEFYGRDFVVSPDTLTPRPETETMIELLLGLAEAPKTIIDVGTGSGCIATTAKLELPGAEVHAVEINEAALKIAKQNAKTLNSDVTFHSGNLLEPILPTVSNQPLIILANLPYVPENFQINLAASHEPRIAIFGGGDGLDLYREMFSQLADTHCVVLTESLPPQHENLRTIAKKSGFAQIDEQDFIQAFKH